MARKQDSARKDALKVEVKRILEEDRDLLKSIISEALQQALEAEMDETLGAEKSERTPSRMSYRSGYYGRGLVTRVGKIELRVPQDRQGRFRTEVFERYQRSEKALTAAMMQMYLQAYPPQGQGDYRGTVRARVQLGQRQPDCGGAG